MANVKSYLSRFMMFVLMLINIFFCLLKFNVRVDLYMHLIIWIKWFLYTYNNFEYFCSVQQRTILYYISRQECFYTNNKNIFGRFYPHNKSYLGKSLSKQGAILLFWTKLYPQDNLNHDKNNKIQLLHNVLWTDGINLAAIGPTCLQIVYPHEKFIIHRRSVTLSISQAALIDRSINNVVLPSSAASYITPSNWRQWLDRPFVINILHHVQ